VPATTIDPAGLAALQRSASQGIHRIPIPTPFAIGDVGVYLIEGDAPALVDAGPNSATALGALELRLAERGYALTDIAHLFITHQHIDHTGLASEIAARSGAQVVALDHLAPVLRDWVHHSEQDDDDAFLLMSRHGVEPHVAEALHAVASIVRGWGAPASVGQVVTDGGTVRLGDHDFDVHWRPGHSPSDTILHDTQRGIIIAGDHLLKDISSNAVIARPLGRWDGSRPKPLVQYRESLIATRALEADVVLGGHGGPVTNHRELIDARLAEYERRAEQFLDLVGDRALTAHEIATEKWGEVAIKQVFLTLSEVIGHLDLLIDDGLLVEDRTEHVIRFARG
jgi:glyoxylase-like metal-dependent hydrolase (beta-lactamase superfamily II)